MKKTKKIIDIETILGKKIKEYIKDKYTENIYLAYTGFLNRDDYDKLNTANHGRDSRTIYEFAKDLIISWVEEDIIIDVLKDKYPDIKFQLNGADKQRQFLDKASTSTKPDLRAFYMKDKTLKEINIEIITDHTRFIEKNNCFDLRDNKFKKLLTQELDTYICAFDFMNKRIAFIKIDDNIEYEEKYNFYYKKNATRVKINYKEYFKDAFTDDKNQLSIFYNEESS